MSYNIFPTEKFQKEAKRLAKKYASLRTELEELNELLLQNPRSGTVLGFDTYKIRLAIKKSKGKGKSGGARVITYVITEDEEIYLLTIYDKSEMASVTDKTLREMVKEIRKSK